MKPYVNPAIVIGGKHNALGIIRNFGQRGIDAYCVIPDHQQFAQYSKYCKGYAVVPGIEHDLDTMHQWLTAITRQAGYPCYIHPTSDLSVLTLSRLLPNLPSHCVTSIPPVEAVETCVIKRRFYKSLAEQEIPHPITFYSDEVAIENIIPQLRFPIYIKPSISQVFVQVFHRKGFVARNIGELRGFLQLVAHHDIDVMIQEIIPGPVVNEYLVRGYFNHALKLMGLTAVQSVRSRPFSVSSALISVPLTEVMEIVPLIIEYLSSLQYHGIFMVELKRDSRDGILKVLEVNPRSGGGNSHALACGFNHVLVAYLEAIGESISLISQYSSNIYSTDLLSDILTISTMLRQRELSWTPLIRSYTQAHSDWLFQWNDLAPFLKQLQTLVRQRFTNPSS